MAIVGIFDSALKPEGWFQHDTPPEGWFSTDMLSTGAGGGAAALASSVSTTVTATSGLTTGIKLAASRTCQVTATSGLTTSITLASSATCGVTATAALSTGIQLASSTTCAASAVTATLTGVAADLVGTAVCASSVVTSALTVPTSIALSNNIPGDPNWSSVKWASHFDTNTSDLIGNTVTVYGSAAISSAQSKFGGSSLNLTGWTSYVSIPGAALGTLNDCTFEFFTYITALSGAPYNGLIYCYGSNGSDGIEISIKIDGNLYVSFGSTALVNGAPISQNAWHHIALVRSGTTATFYLDGVAVGSGTYAPAMTWNQPIYLGWNAASYGPAGYYDDLRVSNVARYTTNFTPPTAAFLSAQVLPGAVCSATATLTGAAAALSNTVAGDPYWANTSLAMHLEDTVDLRGHSVANAGATPVTFVAGKFGNAASFPGTNDGSLVLPDSADWQFGSGDFTVEFWLNTTSFTTSDTPIILYGSGVATSQYGFVIYARSNYVIAQLSAGGSTEVPYTTANVVSGGWIHIALVRSGTNLILFVDGANSWSNTNYTASIDVPTGTPSLYIGGSIYPAGYTAKPFLLDDLRITKGVARYTTNFTPPASAFLGAPLILGAVCTTTATLTDAVYPWAGTAACVVSTVGGVLTTAIQLDSCVVGDSMWTNVDVHMPLDSSITDTKGHTLTAYNGAALSSAQSVSGGQSLDLSAGAINSASYVQVGGLNYHWITESWAVEASFYLTATTGGYAFVFQTPSVSQAGLVKAYLNSSGLLIFACQDLNGNSTAGSAGVYPTANTWHHIAITYSPSDHIFRGWYEGTQVFTFDISSFQDIAAQTGWILGDGSHPFSGYIGNFRFTKAVRYTSTFTPPTMLLGGPVAQGAVSTATASLSVGSSGEFAASTLAVSTTATAALTTAVVLAGSASATATSTADLTAHGASAALAASVNAATSSTAALTTAIQLAASVSTTVTSTAALTSEAAQLAGTASVVVSASAYFPAQAALQGTAVVSLSFNAPLTTGIKLAATASAVASRVSAVLTVSAGALAASRTCQVTATGALTTAVKLAASVAVKSTGTAYLRQTTVPLAGTAKCSVKIGNDATYSLSYPTLPHALSYMGIAAAGGRFLAFDAVNVGVSVLESYDGETWVDTGVLTVGISTYPNLLPCFGAGGYFYTGITYDYYYDYANHGPCVIYASRDAVNWVKCNFAGPENVTSFVRVIYGNGVYLALVTVPSVGKVIYRSTDGVNWGETTRLLWSGSLIWDGTQFCAHTFFNGSATQVFTTSFDGLTWTAKGTALAFYTPSLLVGANSFIVCGGWSYGNVYSLDGYSWYPSSVPVFLNPVTVSDGTRALLFDYNSPNSGIGYVITGGDTFAAVAVPRHIRDAKIVNGIVVVAYDLDSGYPSVAVLTPSYTVTLGSAVWAGTARCSATATASALVGFSDLKASAYSRVKTGTPRVDKAYLQLGYINQYQLSAKIIGSQSGVLLSPYIASLGVTPYVNRSTDGGVTWEFVDLSAVNLGPTPFTPSYCWDGASFYVPTADVVTYDEVTGVVNYTGITHSIAKKSTDGLLFNNDVGSTVSRAYCAVVSDGAGTVWAFAARAIQTEPMVVAKSTDHGLTWNEFVFPASTFWKPYVLYRIGDGIIPDVAKKTGTEIYVYGGQPINPIYPAYVGGKLFVPRLGNAVQDAALEPYDMLVSTDGFTWTPTAMPGGASTQWSVIAFINGMYIAYPIAQGTSEGYTYATSPDGLTWTRRSVEASNVVDGKYQALYISMAFDGTKLYCAAMDLDELYSSADGLSWTAEFRSSTAPIVYGNKSDYFTLAASRVGYRKEGHTLSGVQGAVFALGYADPSNPLLMDPYTASNTNAVRIPSLSVEIVGTTTVMRGVILSSDTSLSGTATCYAAATVEWPGALMCGTGYSNSSVSGNLMGMMAAPRAYSAGGTKSAMALSYLAQRAVPTGIDSIAALVSDASGFLALGPSTGTVKSAVLRSYDFCATWADSSGPLIYGDRPSHYTDMSVGGGRFAISPETCIYAQLSTDGHGWLLAGLKTGEALNVYGDPASPPFQNRVTYGPSGFIVYRKYLYEWGDGQGHTYSGAWNLYVNVESSTGAFVKRAEIPPPPGGYYSSLMHHPSDYIHWQTLVGTPLGVLALADRETYVVSVSFDNAATWTQYSLSNTNGAEDAAYGNGVCVMIPSRHAAARYGNYSTDLVNWFQMDLGVSQLWKKVVFVAGLFVAWGADGSDNTDFIYVSLDGINWVQRATPATTGLNGAASLDDTIVFYTPTGLYPVVVARGAPLQIPIALAASVQAVVTTTANLTSTSAALAATPAVAVTTTAALTTGIPLAAAPTVTVTATADLTTAVKLSASVASTVTVTAPIDTAIKLVAAPQAVVTTTGALTTSVRLAAAANVACTATASLTTAIKLGGTTASQVTVVNAAFATAQSFQAAVSCTSTVTPATLNTSITMSAAPATVVTATAALLTAIKLRADAFCSVVAATAMLGSTSEVGVSREYVQTPTAKDYLRTPQGRSSVMVAANVSYLVAERELQRVVTEQVVDHILTRDNVDYVQT